MKRKRESIIDRFWARVDTSGGCWLWTGSRYENGYGKVRIEKRDRHAHRAAWELEYGEIDPGLFVCHKCDVRLCVRPDHLFLGTHKDNMADMKAKKRAASSDRIGELNWRAKLTIEQVQVIRQLRQSGLGSTVIAKQFGVSHGTVSDILRGRRWRAVGGWPA